MKIKLHAFKKALQSQISLFIQQTQPFDKRHTNSATHLVVFNSNKRYFAYLLDLKRHHCLVIEDIQRISDLAKQTNTSKLYPHLNEEEQNHISALLQCLVPPQDEQTLEEEQSGVALWMAIHGQLNKMPGWWHFFSPLRALTLSLEEVLEDASPHDLKAEDNTHFNTLLRTLKTRINHLVASLNELTVKNQELARENEQLKNEVDEGLISQEKAQHLIQEQVDQLLHSKKALLTELEQLKKAYRLAIEKNNTLEEKLKDAVTETKALSALNAELEQENQQLRETLENLADDVEKHAKQIEETASSFLPAAKGSEQESSRKSSGPGHTSVSIQEINANHQRNRQRSGATHRNTLFPPVRNNKPETTAKNNEPFTNTY